jgi:hypothetical protein
MTVAEYESMGGMTQVVQTEVDILLAAEPEQTPAKLDACMLRSSRWLATISPRQRPADAPPGPLGRPAAASRPLHPADWWRSGCWSRTTRRRRESSVEVALESMLRPNGMMRMPTG